MNIAASKPSNSVVALMLLPYTSNSVFECKLINVLDFRVPRFPSLLILSRS